MTHAATQAPTGDSSLPTPLRPARDPRLDIVRGWLQLTIFASHAFGSFIGGWLIHTSWGLSDSSELFVFLSGYTLGSVFVLKMLRQGFGAATWDMLGRAGRLYALSAFAPESAARRYAEIYRQVLGANAS